jgi:Domain of unknown function (DUF4116)
MERRCLITLARKIPFRAASGVIIFLEQSATNLQYFTVPHCFRENENVMLAICAQCPFCFAQASLRLRDDEEFVKAALLSIGDEERDERDIVIPYTSQRLLTDKNMFFYAVRMGYCTQSFIQTWLGAVEYGRMEIQEQRELGHLILRGLRHFEQPFRFYFPSMPSFAKNYVMMPPLCCHLSSWTGTFWRTVPSVFVVTTRRLFTLPFHKTATRTCMPRSSKNITIRNDPPLIPYVLVYLTKGQNAVDMFERNSKPQEGSKQAKTLSWRH